MEYTDLRDVALQVWQQHYQFHVGISAQIAEYTLCLIGLLFLTTTAGSRSTSQGRGRSRSERHSRRARDERRRSKSRRSRDRKSPSNRDRQRVRSPAQEVENKDIKALVETITQLNIQGVKEQQVTEVATVLVAKGVLHTWQLETLTPDLVDALFPPAEKLQMNLVIKRAASVLKSQNDTRTYQNQPVQDFFTKAYQDQADSMKKMMRECRKHMTGGDQALDELDDDDLKGIDITKALGRYGLDRVNAMHLMPPDDLKRMIRTARARQKEGDKVFLAGGYLEKLYVPNWMGIKARPNWKREQGEHWHSFAQFASCYSSRVLAQLAVQGDTQSETVSVAALLNSFLDICKLAIEDRCTVAWEYDDDLWRDLKKQVEFQRSQRKC